MSRETTFPVSVVRKCAGEEYRWRPDAVAAVDELLVLHAQALGSGAWMVAQADGRKTIFREDVARAVEDAGDAALARGAPSEHSYRLTNLALARANLEIERLGGRKVRLSDLVSGGDDA